MAWMIRIVFLFGLSSAFLLVWNLEAVASSEPRLKLRAGTIQLQELSQNYQWTPIETQNWIVQFLPNTSLQQRQDLLSYDVLAYLPEDAYVVSLKTAEQLLQLRSKDSVFAVHPFEAAWKLSPELGRAHTFNAHETLEVLVQCYAPYSCEKLASKVPGLKQKDARFLVAELSRKQMYFLAREKAVEHIQPAPVYETFSFPMVPQSLPLYDLDLVPLTGDESGTWAMGFPAAWEKGFRGEGQIVAYADTGLDVGEILNLHKDFQGAVLAGEAFGVGAESWEDPQGHGTHVAGSLVGRGRASGGLLKGGAHGAMLIAQGMWSSMKDGFTVPTQLEQMFQSSYEQGARVHSNSWGSVKHPGVYDSAAVRVDAWTWEHPQMLVVFAAGNNGADLDRDGRVDAGSLATPATAKNSLTVGASENVTSTGGFQGQIRRLPAARDLWPKDPIASSYASDNLNGLAMFSSRGPTLDGRLKPDLVAPGSNILSVRSQMVSAMELWGAYNNDYVWSGGTSMAAPLVAAAATVGRQYLQVEHGFSNPSAALVKALLLHSTVDMYPGQYGDGGAEQGQELLTRRPNADQGYGRLNVAEMVQLQASTQFVDHVGLSEKEEFAVDFKVLEKSSILANLVWTDPPASVNSAEALVNDLDLVLMKDGEVVFQSEDRLNNTELLEASSLDQGSYRLVVRAHRVVEFHGKRQPFALVLTLKASSGGDVTH